MKPLARWTIGGTSSIGFETLALSVRMFRRLYPEFDCVICHNHLGAEEVRAVERLGQPVYAQRPEDAVYPLVPLESPSGKDHSMPGWGWKLVPPRLRMDRHELWIDNDIIIRERLPTIDEWLRSNLAVISTGHKRAYGIFEPWIDPSVKYCAGLFGLPPGFDFGDSILRCCDRLGGGPLGYYDEQGVTVTSVIGCGCIPIPFDEVSIIKTLRRPYPKGMHFIGVNRTECHKAWSDYKCCILM